MDPASRRPTTQTNSWLRTLLRWYIGLIIRPTPTIREIVERRPVWAGVGTVCAAAGFWMGLEGVTIVLADVRRHPRRINSYSHIGRNTRDRNVGDCNHRTHRGKINPYLRKCGWYVRRPIGGVCGGILLAAIGFTIFLLDRFVVPGQRIVSLDRTFEWLTWVAAGWLILMIVIVVRENYGTDWGRTAIITVGGLALGVPLGDIADNAADYCFFCYLLCAVIVNSLALHRGACPPRTMD